MTQPSRNRGSAVLALVLALFIVLFFTVAPLVTKRWVEALNVGQNEAKYLDEVAARLARYYRDNAGTIDAGSAYAIAPATLWGNLGIEPLPTLRLAISDRITGPTVRYRKFAVWLRRANPDTSAMVPATGVFTAGPNVLFREVSGEPIQAGLIEETQVRMKALAAQLEKRFRAKFESDPFRSLTVNHFRVGGAPSCASATSDDIPCIDIHTDVQSAANFPLLLSIEAPQLVTAWGQRFTVSNLADSQTSGPPYSMAIRGALPWGGTLLVNAVQPLN